MERAIRQFLLRMFTGEWTIVFTNAVPSRQHLRDELGRLEALGLYLHIPFCEQICPYCPYNKELYRNHLGERYCDAVMAEMDFYAEMIRQTPVTSLYIGGGTPTTLLERGLGELIEHLRGTFNLQCDIHLESHPNHLSAENLARIRALGVRHLSLGVEALVDRHLHFLCRPYTAEAARQAVRRAVAAGFQCVNVDMIFALPGQTCEEIEQTGRELVQLGVDQVAAYPLFRFPYTALGRNSPTQHHVVGLSLRRRKMLRILEDIFYRAGYERTSVWAFTRRGVPRYCSVTVPLYVGLGASGGSYLQDLFYLNTFGVTDYVTAMEQSGRAVALSLDLTDRMQRAGWLYWRIYETRFAKAEYRARFDEDIDRTFGRHFWLLQQLGLLHDDGERITLSDAASFWLHAGEDVLSIDYISKLWSALQRNAWPEQVVL